MTLTIGGGYSIERRTIASCDLCAQQEVEGFALSATHEDADALVCIDCFTRGLDLPTDETQHRLRVLLCDVEAELSRGRFPSVDLFRRLRRETGNT